MIFGKELFAKGKTTEKFEVQSLQFTKKPNGRLDIAPAHRRKPRIGVY
jgi:hypothetical protein